MGRGSLEKEAPQVDQDEHTYDSKAMACDWMDFVWSLLVKTEKKFNSASATWPVRLKLHEFFSNLIAARIKLAIPIPW